MPPKTIDVSIIIPTLNEEKNIVGCLTALRDQDFSGHYEIIVADADSTDATLEIARSYQCVVVSGGLPATSRNNGARVAKGELLFFLDADTVLANGALTKSLQEFNARNLDIASFCLHPYPEKKLSYFLINTFYNKLIIFMEKMWPYYAMAALVKKDIFDALQGFDESIRLAEDMDFARRATRYGRFGIIRSVEIFFSDRRFVKEGWVRLGVKYFLCGLHEILIGPVRSDIFNYRFNHYKEE